MSRLSLRPHRQQQVLLAACTTSRIAPAPHLSRRRDRDRPVGFADVASLEDPEWARADRNVSRYSVPGLVPSGQLAEMPLTAPAEDAVSVELAAARAKLLVPMHRRADNLPALYEWSGHVSVSRDAACEALAAEDRQRREDIAAAAWIDEAVGAEMAACLADIAQTLADQPRLAHEHAVLMALAPVVAQLAGVAFVAMDELPDWVQNVLRRQGNAARAAIHRSAFGAPHLTSIIPHATYSPSVGSYHLCHRCQADPWIRGIGREQAPASTVTILTVVGEVA